MSAAATFWPATKPYSPSTTRAFRAEVFDVRSFENWWREALARARPKLLTMREEDLLEGEGASDARGLPDPLDPG